MWLSLSAFVGDELPKASWLDEVVADAQGLHVDLHATKDSSQVIAMLRAMKFRWPSSQYDLHLLSEHGNAVVFCESARSVNPNLRQVWSAKRIATGGWAPAASVADVATNYIDLPGQLADPLLLTAPASYHPLADRARLVNRALEIVRIQFASIGLDRDLTRELGELVDTDLIDEVVVGKAILSNPNPVRALSAFKRSWSKNG